jgi:hypothetical protein
MVSHQRKICGVLGGGQLTPANRLVQIGFGDDLYVASTARQAPVWGKRAAERGRARSVKAGDFPGKLVESPPESHYSPVYVPS